MKNRKINLDRPRIDSKEIQSHKDFNQVLENFNMMSKPFYKSAWFLGGTGLASLGLIIGGTIAFQDPSQQVDLNTMNSEAPPDLTVPDNSLIALNANFNDSSADLAKETLKLYNSQNSDNLTNEDLYDNNSTLEENTNTENTETTEENSSSEENVTTHDDPSGVDISNRNGFSRMDLSPKIGGKLDGGITRAELLDTKGITAGANVEVVHFELHLLDGFGGKVLTEDSNQLSAEMRSALDRVLVGEMIYFENIQGKSENGEVVKLNPLRYTLLN